MLVIKRNQFLIIINFHLSLLMPFWFIAIALHFYVYCFSGAIFFLLFDSCLPAILHSLSALHHQHHRHHEHQQQQQSHCWDIVLFIYLLFIAPVGTVIAECLLSHVQFPIFLFILEFSTNGYVCYIDSYWRARVPTNIRGCEWVLGHTNIWHSFTLKRVHHGELWDMHNNIWF